LLILVVIALFEATWTGSLFRRIPWVLALAAIGLAASTGLLGGNEAAAGPSHLGIRLLAAGGATLLAFLVESSVVSKVASDTLLPTFTAAMVGLVAFLAPGPLESPP